MQSDTSGRVLPLRGGDLMSPAVCLICRRPGSNVEEEFADPSELFADPHITEDFFGSVYFCKSCSLEIAAIFGAKSNDEVLQLEADLMMYKAISEEQAETLKDLNEALNALRRIDSRNSGLDFIGGPPMGYTSIDETEPSTQQGLPESTEQRTDESPEPTESSNGEGPDDVDESERDNVDEWLRNL